MILLGINAQNHDASVSVLDTDTNSILFGGHAERYSRSKNDKHLNEALINDALSYCNGQIDKVVWYENPTLKQLRYAYAGQWSKLIFERSPKRYLNAFGITSEIEYSSHHLSHAAGGFYTSNFDEAVVVVVDAIGEFETTSIYKGKDKELNKLFSSSYPHSVGLFYSAITHLVGLKPNEEEYILMGMSAYGDAQKYYQKIKEELIFIDDVTFKVRKNLHKGISGFIQGALSEQDTFDLAASAQLIVEEYLVKLMQHARKISGSNKLVFSGGVALNCVANSRIAKEAGFDKIWIMPNPGDAGNSLGAILNKTRTHTQFSSPYLGYDIKRTFNKNGACKALLDGKIIGVANGRAEFGPRALGNRSLLADPRGTDIKDKMNEIKKRQKFRPFAPIVLADHAHKYFDMPFASSEFMQFTAKVKSPELFPAICHHDNTARVQTLTKEMNPVMYNLIKAFYNKTGCPILVNTSLNIKGEPLVNTWKDATRFSEKYNVEVF